MIELILIPYTTCGDYGITSCWFLEKDFWEWILNKKKRKFWVNFCCEVRWKYSRPEAEKKTLLRLCLITVLSNCMNYSNMHTFCRTDLVSKWQKTVLSEPKPQFSMPLESSLKKNHIAVILWDLTDCRYKRD